IRSTIFFKGCPLVCIWCHNPESISPRLQIHWEKTRCIGCRSCIDACAKGALTAQETDIVIDRLKCDSCGACSQTCPSTAMEVYGEAWNLDDLVREVLKDEAYFKKSGGGVTLSGGEPTMQPLFAKAVVSAFKQAGIHIALDTCGQCSWETLDALLPYTDLVLYDLKEINADKHKAFTGISNTRILENLILLSRFMKEHRLRSELWIRTPLIPGCTDTPENLRGIGIFIKEHLEPCVSRWELCTFNNLCIHKYEGLGIQWEFRNAALLSRDEAKQLAFLARESGVDPEIIHLSGPTREVYADESLEDKTRAGIARSGAC
ncbi:MAG TPA: glycyl-radical enzyme activating protein, partial [Thermodesulfovibrionales bacterium]|nr:glycyl-radical enzyme activating protein [Thermodesulfovibrionales bacterium]